MTNGTITGLDGDFSLSNKKEILFRFFVGYITQRGSLEWYPLNVILKDDTQTLA